MEIKKQPIGNGFCFGVNKLEFMAYNDLWWVVRAIHGGFELVQPTRDQQIWLDTFTEIVKGS